MQGIADNGQTGREGGLVHERHKVDAGTGQEYLLLVNTCKRMMCAVACGNLLGI